MSHEALSGFSHDRAFAPAVGLTIQYVRGFREPTLSDRYFRESRPRFVSQPGPRAREEKSFEWRCARRSREASVELYGYLNGPDVSNGSRRRLPVRNSGEKEVPGARSRREGTLTKSLRRTAVVARGRSGTKTLSPRSPGSSPFHSRPRRSSVWWGSRRFTSAKSGSHRDRDGPQIGTSPRGSRWHGSSRRPGRTDRRAYPSRPTRTPARSGRRGTYLQARW